MLVRPTHVYVPPPHSIVTLIDGHLMVEMPPPDSERVLRPIDGFFDSLGAALRERAVGMCFPAPAATGRWDSRPLRPAAA
jgi:hypothetical protein